MHTQTHRHQHGTMAPSAADRAKSVVVFLGCMLLFCTIPWFIVTVHRTHVSDVQSAKDGHTLDGLSSFRDLLWEVWGAVNTVMQHSRGAYYTFTVLLFAGNAVLWWYWFARRLVKERQVHLAVKLVILVGVSVVCNCVSWFPLPAGFLQQEAFVVTLLFGFVVRDAHQFVSPRVAWSMVLLYDVLRNYRAHWLVSGTSMAVYASLVCLYLWATRQMYSFSLITNVVFANVAWYMGDDAMKRLRRRRGRGVLEKQAERVRANGADGDHLLNGKARYEIGSEGSADDDDADEDVVQMCTAATGTEAPAVVV